MDCPIFQYLWRLQLGLDTRTVAKIEKHAPAPHRVLGRCLLNLTSAPWHVMAQSESCMKDKPVQTCANALRKSISIRIIVLKMCPEVLDMSVFQGKVAASSPSPTTNSIQLRCALRSNDSPQITIGTLLVTSMAM